MYFTGMGSPLSCVRPRACPSAVSTVTRNGRSGSFSAARSITSSGVKNPNTPYGMPSSAASVL